MSKRCVVQFCGNSCFTGHSTHRFPKDPVIRRQWVRFVQTKRADFQPPSEKSQAVICGAHFEKDCFSGHLMAEMGFGLKKTKLKPEAVPTIQATPTPEQVERYKVKRLGAVLTEEPGPSKAPRKSRAYAKREVHRVSACTQYMYGLSFFSCPINSNLPGQFPI